MTTPLHTITPGSEPLRGATSAMDRLPDADFRQVLTQFASSVAPVARVEAGEGGPSESSRAIAEDLVAVTFVQPLLRQMREMQQLPPPFGPGQAEKQLSALMDERLSTQIVRASRYPLVDRLAADIDRMGAAAAGARFADQPQTVDRGSFAR
ncbi:MAG: hypothetical protein KF866_06370 [Phycisphaeraceae bacterium]|nr:hypothetical protein [Phycisphaeraceae bacterium]